MPAALPDRHNVLNRKFADAWRVTDQTSLFDYAMGSSTKTFTDKDWPPDKPPCRSTLVSTQPVEPMKQQEAEEHCRKVEDKVANANCVFDVMVTGEPGFAASYVLSQFLKNQSAMEIANQ
jgi:hypothetical protein